MLEFAEYTVSLLLLVRLQDQFSSTDEVGGLLQVLQAPIYGQSVQPTAIPNCMGTLTRYCENKRVIMLSMQSLNFQHRYYYIEFTS